MSLPKALLDNLSLPVIGAPLFIISNPKLVVAQCTSGVVGAMPALNARPAGQLDAWLAEITGFDTVSFQPNSGAQGEYAGLLAIRNYLAANGDGERSLLPGDIQAEERDPAWSPDGRWIAYTGYDDKNYTSHLSSLYIMDSNGSGKRLLAGNLMSSPVAITWAHDSSGVYYTVEEKGATICLLYTSPSPRDS